MNSFTTRVELHHATDDDYAILHGAMAAQGFSRTITSDDNITYHLPTAEYNRSTPLTRSQVLDSAKIAAETTAKQFSILVTESTGRTWYNLSKVD
jgi:hypothetical protein